MRHRSPLILTLCSTLLGLAPGAGASMQDDEATLEMRKQVRKLQPQIDAAIDKGVKWLIGRQRANGTWPGHEDHYPSGQTALTVYTLLKMGVELEHPAVAKGLLAMLARPPLETYSAGCQLIAFEATGDPAYRDRMQEILDDLLEWQDRGLWSYPHPHGQRGSSAKGIPDLSNTQYAALGLRACRLAGLEVPQRAWSSLLDKVDDARVELDSKQLRELSYEGTRSLSGYRYRTGGGNATGSMTAAGIAITQIAIDGLDLPPNHSERRKAERAIHEGSEWLGLFYRVDENPHHGKNWRYYYLYGVERVGSFLDTERLGDKFWYLPGARYLVQQQSKDGTWRQNNTEADTCFGLLFLKRASYGGATTGVKAKAAPAAMVCDAADSDVHLRGTGLPKCTVWVTGFSEAVRDLLGGAPTVTKVEYTVDGEVITTLEPEPAPWTDTQRFAIQHEFTRPGKHQVSVRVSARKADPAEGAELVLTSAGFTVEIKEQSGAPYLRLAKDLLANRIPGARPSASVSTRVKPETGGEATTDGNFASRWLFEDSDEKPWIRIKLRRKVDASTLVLAPAAINTKQAADFDHIRQVEVFVNGSRKGQIVTLHEDPLVATSIPLLRPQKVQSVEIHVLERRPGRSKGRGGFSEIGLLE